MKGGEPLFVFVRGLRTLRLNIGRSWAALSPPWRNSSRRFRWDGWRSGWDIPQRSFPGPAFLWDSHPLQFRFRFCLRGFAFFGILRGFRFFGFFRFFGRFGYSFSSCWGTSIISKTSESSGEGSPSSSQLLSSSENSSRTGCSIFLYLESGWISYLKNSKIEKSELKLPDSYWMSLYPPWTQSYNPLIRQERCRNRHADGLLKWGLDALYEISPTPHWTN